MEIDCGAAITVISFDTYKKYFKSLGVTSCNSRLVVVDGQQLNIFGEITVNASVNNVQDLVKLIILDSPRNFVPLLGRNWLDRFYPNWRKTFGNAMNINAMRNDPEQNSAQQIVMGFEADLVLREEKPIFRKAYDVPFKLREKVIEHLDSLEKQNVITPIQIQL
ncbi:uncharacterized protein LOC135701672 [Ochlerotatus camptorhynchus]